MKAFGYVLLCVSAARSLRFNILSYRSRLGSFLFWGSIWIELEGSYTSFLRFFCNGFFGILRTSRIIGILSSLHGTLLLGLVGMAMGVEMRQHLRHGWANGWSRPN